MTALHVFIASPGGLEDERRAFKEVIERVNIDHAHEADVTFIPRGWEYAAAGVGRPQEIINRQVRESDYLIVVLWDRWGRPTGNEGYTSGTEEEFRVGVECLRDATLPMRDIVVLFKGVNKRQLADPGKDLQKVLDFKDELERNRTLLFATFDTLDEFRDDFRSHLHDWIRDWQGEGEPPEKKPSSMPPTDGDGGVASPSEPEAGAEEPIDESALTLAQRAKAAVDRGRFTAAEQLFAQATTGNYDREAWTEYVRYLRKSGRISLAQTASETFLGLAQDADDHTGEIEALANLAILERQQGKNISSLQYLTRALQVVDELVALTDGDQLEDRKAALSTKAFLLDNTSLTLRRIPGRSDEALRALSEAKSVQEETGDRRGAGFTARNVGSLLTRLGRLDEAEEALTESLRIFDEVSYPNGQATALWSLGEVFEAKGDIPMAIEMLDRSVAVSPIRSPSRTANNYAVLSRLHLKLGHLEQAKDLAEYCLRAAQELGTPESRATALHADGAVALASGEVDRGIQDLEEALVLFQQVDNQVGVAAVRLSLARHHLGEGSPQRARENLAEASEVLARAPHHSLARDLAELQGQVDAAIR